MFVEHEVITSIDQLEDPLVAARTSPMVLRAGGIHAEWSRAELGGALVEVGEYSCPVATRGETLADRIVLLTPLQSSGFGQLNGQPLALDVLHVWGEATEVSGSIWGPAVVGIVSLSRQALEATAEILGIEVHIPLRGAMRTVHCADRPSLRAVFGAVRRAARDPHDSTLETDASTLDARVSEIGARALAAGDVVRVWGSEARRRSLRVVQACEDHASLVRFQGVTIADLCSVSNASERRVRLAFSHCYGMSPTAYLRIVALHKVRRVLLAPPSVADPVSRAAVNFGFWHLGRFAGQYRALFGESPSDTIDHARERVRLSNPADREPAGVRAPLHGMRDLQFARTG